MRPASHIYPNRDDERRNLCNPKDNHMNVKLFPIVSRMHWGRRQGGREGGGGGIQCRRYYHKIMPKVNITDAASKHHWRTGNIPPPRPVSHHHSHSCLDGQQKECVRTKGATWTCIFQSTLPQVKVHPYIRIKINKNWEHLSASCIHAVIIAQPKYTPKLKVPYERLKKTLQLVKERVRGSFSANT